MTTFADIGFYSLFIAGIVFSVITIIRATKFSVIWSSLAMLFWFALAQVTPWVFVNDTPLIALSWLWYAVGIVFEILGITFTLMSLKADSEGRDLEI